MSLDGDSSKAVSTPQFTYGDIALQAFRSGIAGTKENCPQGTLPYYVLSGNQSITIEELPDPKVRALETMLSTPDTVRFMASNIPPGLSPRWVFFGGDVAPTPHGAPPYNYIQACTDKSTCDHPVTTSGRMYLGLFNGLGGVVWYPSEIVWVGRTATAEVSMACSPVSVPIGGQTTCTAGVTPSDSALTVHEWFFVPDGDGAAVMETCGPANPCTYAVPGNGTIFVKATAGGIVQTVSEAVAIGASATCADSLATLFPSCRTLAGDSAAALTSDFQNDSTYRTNHVKCDSIRHGFEDLFDAGRVYVATHQDLDAYFPPQAGQTAGGAWLRIHGVDYIVIASWLFAELNTFDPYRSLRLSSAAHEAAHTFGYPDDPVDGMPTTYQIGSYCARQSEVDPWGT